MSGLNLGRGGAQISQGARRENGRTFQAIGSPKTQGPRPPGGGRELQRDWARYGGVA
jgi:hypothetical protein